MLIILNRTEIITVHDELNVPTLIVKRAHERINRGRGQGSEPHWKTHMAIGFLRNSGTDTPNEAIGSNCFLREVCIALCQIC